MNVRRRLPSLGLLLVTAALLVAEIAFTRVLSVVMWYHFAFLALSVALFGLAAGGLAVHLLPRLFRRERLFAQAWGASLGLALLAPGAFLLLAENPAYRHLTSAFRPAGFGPADALGLAVLYGAGALPFLAGGLVAALLFRHHADAAGRLYFADLAGAGAGCLLAVPALDRAGGPGALLVSGALAALGAGAFALAAGRAGRARALAALVLAAGLAAAVVVQAREPFLHVRFARGRELTGIRFERWNSYSRVTVRDFGEPDSLVIQIDAASNTYIGRWDGDPASVAHLTRDLVAAPYALLARPKVLVIGPGGGIDLLVARAAGAASVVGVEVNPAIVDAMTGPFAAFSGQAYAQPGVRIETDEARSYIRRSHERFDLIQAGYIDTYAATAAGAFALTENTLYTVDAYLDHLDHLTADGLVAMQRYFEEPPQQSARLVVLALAALSRRGVAEPGRHVVVLRRAERASVLVRRSPFAEADVAALEAWATGAGIELVAAPGRPGHGVYARLLAAGRDWPAVVRAQALDLSPVGDDRPFFFYVVKPERFWKGLAAMTGERMHSRAVVLLVALVLGSFALCALLVLLPLAGAEGRKAAGGGALPAIGYFFALGLGFMLVEIGLLQRTMLFLGHPALSLSVVLSTLLLSAGLGARATQRIPLAASGAALRLRLALVLASIVLVAFAWPPLFRVLLGLPRAGRIAVTIAALLPVGFLLGQALPLGLRRLAAARAALVPWAWAVNGGASVFGSVLAMAIAINNGYTATLLAGAVAYAAAWALAPRTDAPA